MKVICCSRRSGVRNYTLLEVLQKLKIMNRIGSVAEKSKQLKISKKCLKGAKSKSFIILAVLRRSM